MIARPQLPWSAEEHGPLPLFLLVLTFVTGLIDALSFLNLGRVFVANMTGNVVFLGFALAGAQGFSIAASVVALAAFLVGALAGGRLGTTTGAHRGRYLAVVSYWKVALIGAALAVAIATPASSNTLVLVALLAIAMGLQNAAARRLGVPDLTTTVLTLTLTGLAADSRLAGGRNSRPTRRVLTAATMLAGAAVGAVVAVRLGSSAVLALVLGIEALSAIAASLVSSSTAAWTKPR
jgi:uncharacterized membrane protein YoaK (UPF0700 family)